MEVIKCVVAGVMNVNQSTNQRPAFGGRSQEHDGTLIRFEVTYVRISSIVYVNSHVIFIISCKTEGAQSTKIIHEHASHIESTETISNNVCDSSVVFILCSELSQTMKTTCEIHMVVNSIVHQHSP